MTFYLLAGRERDCLTRRGVRLRGWLNLYTTLAHNPQQLETVWQRHRDALVEEARRHGFTPVAANWFTEDGRLRDDADDVVTVDADSPHAAWASTFLREHGY